MSDAFRGSTTFVVPPGDASAFQQQAQSAISLTQECRFYSVATDAMEAESHSSNTLVEYEENWLPTSRALPLSRGKGESYNSEFEACVECTPGLFGSGCQCADRSTADSKRRRLQLASLVNALLMPPSALPTNLEANDLLATVKKHALAAGSLAHQYSCAVSSARVESQNTLSACLAQYMRLKQARQAYLSALLHLSNSLQASGAATTHLCMCARTRFLASVVSDLLALERLRKKAERLTTKKINEECAELQAMQDTCRARLSAREPFNYKQLEGLVGIESSALRLSHAASLFDLRSLIKMLEQASPHEGRAAEMIIKRVTTSKALPETPCALSTEDCECSKILNGVVTVLRIFELERMLAPRLAAGTRRLLRLLRLATNLESASAHLYSFAAVLVGPPADDQEALPQRCDPSAENVGLRQAQPEAAPTISMRKMRGASQRLLLHGVAFHHGALLRAIGLSPEQDFALWQNCKTQELLGLPHPDQMLTKVDLLKDRSNVGCLQTGCKLRYGNPLAAFAQRNAEAREPAAMSQWINPDHTTHQSPESFMQWSIDPLLNDGITCLLGEGINGLFDLRGAERIAAPVQLLKWPKAFEPHDAQDRESRASPSCRLDDDNGLPHQQMQENKISLSSILSERHHKTSAAASVGPPCCHSRFHRLSLPQYQLAFTPAPAHCCTQFFRCESSLKELPSIPQSEQRSESASRSILSVGLARPHAFAAGATTAACCSEEWLERAAQQGPKDAVMLLPSERRHGLKRRPLSSDLEERIRQGSVRLSRNSQAEVFSHHNLDSHGARHVASIEENNLFYESATAESSAWKQKLPAASCERHAKHARHGRPRCISWLKSGSATICALSSTVTSTCRKLVAHSQGDDPPTSADDNSTTERVWTVPKGCKATPPCSNPLKPKKVLNLLETVGSRACGDLVHGWMQARRANEARTRDETSRDTEQS